MAIKAVAEALLEEPKEEPSCFEQNISPISFAISSLAIMSLRPTSFLIGVIGGIGIHQYQWIRAKKDSGGRMIPILSAIYAIVGAVAALVSCSAGGIMIHSVHLLSSVTIGMTLYKAVKL